MNIRLKESFITTLKITLASLIMYLVLMILNEFIPVVVYGRSKAIVIVALYSIVGGLIYFLITYKNIFKKIFGKEIIDKIINKFKKANKKS